MTLAHESWTGLSRVYLLVTGSSHRTGLFVACESPQNFSSDRKSCHLSILSNRTSRQMGYLVICDSRQTGFPTTRDSCHLRRYQHLWQLGLVPSITLIPCPSWLPRLSIRKLAVLSTGPVRPLILYGSRVKLMLFESRVVFGPRRLCLVGVLSESMAPSLLGRSFLMVAVAAST